MKTPIDHNQKEKGFTLIETVVAILILSLTVGALLSLTASSIFSVRYARSQLVANNLAQESLEYIRDLRDTAQQHHTVWLTWLATLNVDTNSGNHALTPGVPSTYHGCFSAKGCIVDPYSTFKTIWEENPTGICTILTAAGCPYVWFYPNTGFYTYASRDHADGFTSGTPQRTTYIRTIYVAFPANGDPNSIIVTVIIKWLNGSAPKTLTQQMLLSNWGQ